jgi:multiple antibiotic resistance protein
MQDPAVSWESFPLYFFRAFMALFPLVNPFGVVTLFLGLTAKESKMVRVRVAARACLIAGILMAVILIAGEVVIEVLGVSAGAVRIAIGLIIAYMGFGMLFARIPSEIPTPEEALGLERFDFIPLGFPGLSGAGALSIMIGFATFIGNRPSLEEKTIGHVVAFSAIAAVLLVSFAILWIATRFSGKLSRQGWEALGRAMGILKVCVGVQFVVNGVKGFLDAAR